MRKVAILLVLAWMGAGAMQAGATVWTGGDGGSWHDSANWDTGILPTNSDTVTIKGGGRPIVSLGGAQSGRLFMRPISGQTASLDIISGDLYAYNDVRIGYDNPLDSLGALIQTGGTFTAKYGLAVGYPSHPNKGNGVYRIEGGTLDAKRTMMLGRTGYPVAIGRLEVSGASAVIGMKGYNQSAASTLRIELDGSGNVSLINVSVNANLSGVLEVDVGSFGGAGTIDVLTAGSVLNYATYDGAPLVLDAASQAAGFTLGDNGNGTLQVTIPEPATLVILGLGSMTLIRRRRRRA